MRCGMRAIPVVSIAAVQLGFMLGGSIVVETVFALHGVGFLGWESITKNDFPVVQGVVLVFAVIYIVLTHAGRHPQCAARSEDPDNMSIAISTPPAARAWTLRVRNAGFLFGVVICGIVVFAALFGNALIPHDPFVQNLNNRLMPPFWMEGTQASHLLGTDQLGRDYLARLVYGARISLLIGLTTMIISGLIGITIGMIGGYFGGVVDDVVMFLITCRLSIPVTLVALSVVGLVGSSLGLVVLDARTVALGPLRRGGAFDHHAGAQPRLCERRGLRRLVNTAAAVQGDPAEHRDAILPSSRRWRWRSRSCSRPRCRSSASACRRRCRHGD